MRDMSGPPAPSETLIVAVFTSAARAESAVESLWRRGIEPERLSLLARNPRGAEELPSKPGSDWRGQQAVSPHLWFRFPRGALVRVPRLGAVVALGAVALGLTEGPPARRGRPRLAVALRRLGLDPAEVPHLERALRQGRVLLIASVPRSEVTDWGAALQVGGASSVSAHARHEPQPPHQRPGRWLRPARRAGARRDRETPKYETTK